MDERLISQLLEDAQAIRRTGNGEGVLKSMRIIADVLMKQAEHMAQPDEYRESDLAPSHIEIGFRPQLFEGGNDE